MIYYKRRETNISLSPILYIYFGVYHGFRYTRKKERHVLRDNHCVDYAKWLSADLKIGLERLNQIEETDENKESLLSLKNTFMRNIISAQDFLLSSQS